jgi:CheY-like chemotaxis protein
VLIVDDNVDAATRLGTLLRYRGRCVHTCFDGSTAFAAASQPADLERTRIASFDAHLTKPANPDDLFREVATLR